MIALLILETFLNVRISQNNCLSNGTVSLPETYKMNKRNVYNERMIKAEMKTFTPLVFATTKEWHQKICISFTDFELAKLIAQKSN